MVCQVLCACWCGSWMIRTWANYSAKSKLPVNNRHKHTFLQETQIKVVYYFLKLLPHTFCNGGMPITNVEILIPHSVNEVLDLRNPIYFIRVGNKEKQSERWFLVKVQIITPAFFTSPQDHSEITPTVKSQSRYNLCCDICLLYLSILFDLLIDSSQDEQFDLN